MKRISSLFLLSVAMGGTSFAKQVDQQTAVTVANNFISSKLSGTRIENIKLLTKHSIQSSTGVELNTFYVFDVNNKSGFVVVSGDDIVKPILAYSTTHEFQSDGNISPETQYWMGLYEKQISFAIAHNIEATNEAKADWAFYTSSTGGAASKPTNAVSPLLTTTWNQGTYYDIYTPGTGSGKTPVGCVATAMAQIMKYWDAPTTGTGSYSYSQSPYGTLSADFGATTYQWGLMPNSLSSSSSQAAKDAVSLIGYHCAIAVKMNFTPGGSGSYVLAWSSNAKCAENAFKNNFGYKNTIEGASRDNYSDAQWDALLKTELDNERPILYAGYGASGGHAFVFDGYDENDMFHINWGWGGMSNGYFTVNNLAPSALGIGGGAGNFNNNQQALVKIEPSQPGDTLNMVLNAPVTVSASSIQKGTPFNVSTGIWNKGTFAFGGHFSAGVYREADSTFVGHVQYISNQALLGGVDTSYTFASNGMNAMVAGNYFIKILYRADGGSSWLVLPNDSTHINKAYLTVTDTTTPTGINDIELSKSFTIYPNPAHDKIFISLKNFTGKVNAFQVFNLQGQKISTTESTNISLVEIPVSHLAQGIYYLRITTDQGMVSKKLVIHR
jgi:hypothetical protein